MVVMMVRVRVRLGRREMVVKCRFGLSVAAGGPGQRVRRIWRIVWQAGGAGA